MNIKQYNEVMEKWRKALLSYQYNKNEKCVITISSNHRINNGVIVNFEYIKEGE